MLDSVSGSTYGIGNTNFNAFFVPPVLMKGVSTYGFGVTLNIPTANAPEFGGDAFGLGPTASPPNYGAFAVGIFNVTPKP